MAFSSTLSRSWVNSITHTHDDEEAVFVHIVENMTPDDWLAFKMMSPPRTMTVMRERGDAARDIAYDFDLYEVGWNASMGDINPGLQKAYEILQLLIDYVNEVPDVC